MFALACSARSVEDWARMATAAAPGMDTTSSKQDDAAAGDKLLSGY
jgi:hypothetical protein